MLECEPPPGRSVHVSPEFERNKTCREYAQQAHVLFMSGGCGDVVPLGLGYAGETQGFLASA